MGRPPKKKADDFDLDAPPTREEFDFETFLEEVGGDVARVYVYRLLRNGDRDFLDKVAVDVLRGGAEDYLKETHGFPSKYMLGFKNNAGKFVAWKTVRIGETKVAGEDGVSSGGGKRAEVEAKLELMQQRQHELLIAMVAAQKPTPPPDIGALLAGLGAMMGASKGPNLQEVMTGIVAAITALKPTTEHDPIKTFRAMMETAKEFMPERNGGEENIWSVVKDVSKQVVSVFGEKMPMLGAGQNVPGPPQQQLGRVISIPAPVVPQASMHGGEPGLTAMVRPAPQTTTSAQTVSQDQQTTLQQWITAELTLLKSKAAHGKDPEDWIDYILDNDEEPGCAAILAAVGQGVTFEQLLQFDPEIAQNSAYVSWFRILYAGLRDELLPSGVDTRGGGRNTPDAGGHAESSSPTQPDAGTVKAP